MEIVDTNIILRFLLKDNEKLSPKAAELFLKTKLFIPYEILIETIFVLEKVYLFDRERIGSLIEDFLKLDSIHLTNKNLALKAVGLYKTSRFGLVDTFLFAYNKVEGYKIHTFDKALQKIIDSNEIN